MVFCNQDPVTIEEIQLCLSEMFNAEIPTHDIMVTLDKIRQKYADNQFSFEMMESGGGFQFLTKPAYQSSISILLKNKTKRKLSTSAMETLSIIAYKQPTSKGDIELIRGVNCDYAVQKLLERELVEIKGKSEAVGRPLLYGTTTKFMDYFGINSLNELPQLKDLMVKESENEVGEQKEV